MLEDRAGATDAAGQPRRMVLVRAGSCLCAIPTSSVIETMRVLPIQPVEGAPAFVRGVAVIRGAPLPVVDLGAMLGVGGGGDGGRLVTIRVDPGRALALLVDAVVGVEALDESRLEAPPPLLAGAFADRVEALGALDGRALAVLGAARILPEEAWRALGGDGARPPSR